MACNPLYSVTDFIVAPVISVVDVLANAYAVALTMSAIQGHPIGVRFERVLGSLALAQAVTGGAGLLARAVLVALAAVTHSQGSALTCVSGLVNLALLIYVLALTINALSGASGKGTWTVVGISLLAALIVTVVLWYIPVGIAQALGAHLPLR